LSSMTAPIVIFNQKKDGKEIDEKKLDETRFWIFLVLYILLVPLLIFYLPLLIEFKHVVLLCFVFSFFSSPLISFLLVSCRKSRCFYPILFIIIALSIAAFVTGLKLIGKQSKVDVTLQHYAEICQSSSLIVFVPLFFRLAHPQSLATPQQSTISFWKLLSMHFALTAVIAVPACATVHYTTFQLNKLRHYVVIISAIVCHHFLNSDPKAENKCPLWISLPSVLFITGVLHTHTFINIEVIAAPCSVYQLFHQLVVICLPFAIIYGWNKETRAVDCTKIDKECMKAVAAII
ncbi:hypothetical protein PFISCL1PPCAC_21006, partial [Pristionchus fissidentatus]